MRLASCKYLSSRKDTFVDTNCIFSDAFYDLMRTFEVYSDQPEYFRKESQYLDVAAIAPGLYNMK